MGDCSGTWRFVLEQSREMLMERLNLYQGLGLLEILANPANGVITHAEGEMIQERPTEREKIDELISRVQRKSTEDFDKLCSAVIQTGQQELHDQYLCIDAVLRRSINALQNKICQYVLCQFCHVDMLRATSGHPVRIDKIYVDTTFAIHSENPSCHTKQPLAKFSEVFDDTLNTQANRVLVQGIPMAGKSTLIKKLAYDWATSIRPYCDNQNDPDDYERKGISKYQLMFPILLRSLHSTDNADALTLDDILTTSLKKEAGLTENDLQTIKWFLSNEPSKILWLLDGFDELGEEYYCIQRLIRGVDYPETMCIVTSRSEDVQSTRSAMFNMHISMEGFSEEQIIRYTRKYFHTDEKSNKFNQDRQLDTKDGLHEISFNPGWLEIICLLWNKDGKLRKNMKTLLSDFIKLSLLHAERRERWPESAFADNMLEESHYRDILLKFGKLALSGNPHEWKFIFSRKDVADIFSQKGDGDDIALKYGLLCKTQQSDYLTTEKFTFVHSLVQEWCAAYYLHHEIKSNSAESFKYCPSTIQAFLNDTSFHKMLLTFSQEDLNIIFQAFLQKYGQSIKENKKNYNSILDILLVWHKYVGGESKIFSLLRETCVAREITAASFYFCGSLDLHGSALGHMLCTLHNCTKWDLSCQGQPNILLTKQTVRDMVRSIGDTLIQVTSLNLSDNNLQGGGSDVGRMVVLMPKCKELKLIGCDFSKDDLEAFLYNTRDALNQIRKFNYSGNTLRGTGQIIGRLLLQLPSCTEINLIPLTPNNEHQLLTHQDWDAMASVLQNHRLLVETMKIKHQTFAKACESLGKIMLCMPNHKQWNLSGQGLEKHDFADLVRGVDNTQLDVTHLYLRQKRTQLGRFGNKENNLMGAGCSIGKLMVLMPLVSIWHFGGLGLTTQDIKEMSEAVARNMLVVEALHLSENNITGSSTSLASLLCAMPRCTLLNLYQCHLIPADVGPLVDTFERNNIQLQKMDLSSNRLHGAGSTIGRLLVLLSSCSDFRIMSCDLDKSDMEEMVNVIGNTQISLQKMDLSSNRLHGAGSIIGRLLVLLSSCSDFRIERCDLDKSDVEEMVNVIGNTQISVENLDLGDNNLTEGGYSLGKLILQAPSCTSLKVVACKMTTSDLDDITNAASHQTFKLEELDLRYNNFHSGSAEEAMRKMVAKMPALTTCKMEKCGLMPMLEYYRPTLEESDETLRLK